MPVLNLLKPGSLAHYANNAGVFAKNFAFPGRRKSTQQQKCDVIMFRFECWDEGMGMKF